jgi:hypothetical protein
MPTGTPATALLDLLKQLQELSTKAKMEAHRDSAAAKALEMMQPAIHHIRGVLLRGADVYQPEDLAAKLAAANRDEDVGRNLAVVLGSGGSRSMPGQCFQDSDEVMTHCQEEKPCMSTGGLRQSLKGIMMSSGEAMDCI